MLQPHRGEGEELTWQPALRGTARPAAHSWLSGDSTTVTTVTTHTQTHLHYGIECLHGNTPKAPLERHSNLVLVRKLYVAALQQLLILAALRVVHTQIYKYRHRTNHTHLSQFHGDL